MNLKGLPVSPEIRHKITTTDIDDPEEIIKELNRSMRFKGNFSVMMLDADKYCRIPGSRG